jgi:hypothetical protein
VAILRVGRGISRCCPRPTSGAGWVDCDDDDDDGGDEVKEDDSFDGGEVVGRVASTGGKSQVIILLKVHVLNISGGKGIYKGSNRHFSEEAFISRLCRRSFQL